MVCALVEAQCPKATILGMVYTINIVISGLVIFLVDLINHRRITVLNHH